MRVMIFNPWSIRVGGGIDRYVMEVAVRLTTLGNQVKIVATQSLSDEHERISMYHVRTFLENRSVEYVEISAFNMPPFSKPALPKLDGLRTLTRLLKWSDVVFISEFYLIDALFTCLKLIYNRPIVASWGIPIVHYGKKLFRDRLHNLYMSSICRFSAKVFDAHCVSNSDDGRLLKSFGLKKVQIIPPGVDIDRFAPRKKHDSDTFKVLYVGRMVHQKGVDILCAVIEMLKEDGIEFWFVGTGPMLKHVVTLSKTRKNIKVMGYVSDKQLPEVYKECDLLVMPSRWESFGIVAAEGQSSGLPVVASNTTGLKDIVIDGVTGKLVPLGDPKSLAKGIREFYEMWSTKRSDFYKISQAARENAIKRFSWNSTIRDLNDLLQNTSSRRFSSVYRC